MKKLILAIALVGVVIGSTLGGIALADRGVNRINVDWWWRQNRCCEDAPRMESDEGEGVIEVTDGVPVVILQEIYPEVRHVSLIIATGGIYGLDPQDYAVAVCSVGPSKWIVTQVKGDRGYKTVEFDTKEWTIEGYNSPYIETYPFDVYYNYTVTYPS